MLTSLSHSPSAVSYSAGVLLHFGAGTEPALASSLDTMSDTKDHNNSNEASVKMQKHETGRVHANCSATAKLSK